jgi:hypothetical protein
MKQTVEFKRTVRIVYAVLVLLLGGIVALVLTITGGGGHSII